MAVRNGSVQYSRYGNSAGLHWTAIPVVPQPAIPPYELLLIAYDGPHTGFDVTGVSMGHSSKYLKDLKNVGGVARGVKFDLLLVLDFYDGPETGFAFYSSGECLGFSVVAEARHPILRAFAFNLLDGNWARVVKVMTDTLPANCQMVFASETDEATALLRSVSEATELSHYIGVGGAYLDGLAVMTISEMELNNFKTSRTAESYYEIHSRIKELELRKPR